MSSCPEKIDAFDANSTGSSLEVDDDTQGDVSLLDSIAPISPKNSKADSIKNPTTALKTAETWTHPALKKLDASRVSASPRNPVPRHPEVIKHEQHQMSNKGIFIKTSGEMHQNDEAKGGTTSKKIDTTSVTQVSPKDVHISKEETVTLLEQDALEEIIFEKLQTKSRINEYEESLREKKNACQANLSEAMHVAQSLLAGKRALEKKIAIKQVEIDGFSTEMGRLRKSFEDLSTQCEHLRNLDFEELQCWKLVDKAKGAPCPAFTSEAAEHSTSEESYLYPILGEYGVMCDPYEVKSSCVFQVLRSNNLKEEKECLMQKNAEIYKRFVKLFAPSRHLFGSKVGWRRPARDENCVAERIEGLCSRIGCKYLHLDENPGDCALLELLRAALHALRTRCIGSTFFAEINKVLELTKKPSEVLSSVQQLLCFIRENNMAHFLLLENEETVQDSNSTAQKEMNYVHQPEQWFLALRKELEHSVAPSEAVQWLSRVPNLEKLHLILEDQTAKFPKSCLNDFLQAHLQCKLRYTTCSWQSEQYIIGMDTLAKATRKKPLEQMFYCTEEVKQELSLTLCTMLDSAQWNTNPLLYMECLAVLLDKSSNKQKCNKRSLIKSMIAICRTATDNLKQAECLCLQDIFLKQGNSEGSAEKAFYENRKDTTLAYFIAFSVALNLYSDEGLTEALGTLHRITYFPGQFYPLSFVEQFNMSILLIAVLSGSLSGDVSTLSWVSKGFLSIHFSSKRIKELPAHLSFAVRGVIQQTKQYLQAVKSNGSNRLHAQALCILNGLSMDWELSSMKCSVRDILHHHSPEVNFSDLGHVLRLFKHDHFSERQMSDVINMLDLHPAKGNPELYFLIRTLLSQGHNSYAALLASEFTTRFMKSFRTSSGCLTVDHAREWLKGRKSETASHDVLGNYTSCSQRMLTGKEGKGFISIGLVVIETRFISRLFFVGICSYGTNQLYIVAQRL